MNGEKKKRFNFLVDCIPSNKSAIPGTNSTAWLPTHCRLRPKYLVRPWREPPATGKQMKKPISGRIRTEMNEKFSKKKCKNRQILNSVQWKPAGPVHPPDSAWGRPSFSVSSWRTGDSCRSSAPWPLHQRLRHRSLSKTKKHPHDIGADNLKDVHRFKDKSPIYVLIL